MTLLVFRGLRLGVLTLLSFRGLSLCLLALLVFRGLRLCLLALLGFCGLRLCLLTLRSFRGLSLRATLLIRRFCLGLPALFSLRLGVLLTRFGSLRRRICNRDISGAE